MGEVLYPDFETKDRRYTKGGGIDDVKFLPVEDTAPKPSDYAPSEYSAPDEDAG